MHTLNWNEPILLGFYLRWIFNFYKVCHHLASKMTKTTEKILQSLFCKWEFSKSLKFGKWCQKTSHLNYSSAILRLMPFESHLSNKRMTVKRLVFHSFGHHTKAHDVSSSPWDITWDGAKVVPLEVRGQQLWTSEGWPRQEDVLKCSRKILYS